MISQNKNRQAQSSQVVIHLGIDNTDGQIAHFKLRGI